MTLKDIPYSSPNGTPLCLDVHLPAGASGPVPVILMIPGGGWMSCAKNVYDELDPSLGAAGFATVSINYRLSSVAIAPANIHDCKAAVRWIRSNAGTYGFDAERVGVYGVSAGGHLAMMLGCSDGVPGLKENAQSSAVQAICAVCGPTDLTRIAIPEIRERFQALYDVTEQYLGGPVSQRTDLAHLVSPLTYTSAKLPPMLLIHGDADAIVPVEESIIFHEALTKAGARTSLRIVEGGAHDYLWQQTSDEVIAFFNNHLR
jgi:acetyl esterase/lipase